MGCCSKNCPGMMKTRAAQNCGRSTHKHPACLAHGRLSSPGSSRACRQSTATPAGTLSVSITRNATRHALKQEILDSSMQDSTCGSGGHSFQRFPAQRLTPSPTPSPPYSSQTPHTRAAAQLVAAAAASQATAAPRCASQAMQALHCTAPRCFSQPCAPAAMRHAACVQAMPRCVLLLGQPCGRGALLLAGQPCSGAARCC